ncbi:MAG: hypothetical protein ACOX8S_12460 [Christensenellales bacterium]|jgi:hypothetical protein
MTATFPDGIKQFTTKKNAPNGDIVDASHINDLQNEVMAIETELLKTAGMVVDHGALTGLGDNDHPQYVDRTSNETIGGVKTFSSIPVVPSSNPTQVNQVVRKGYADSAYAANSHNHDGVYSPTSHNHDGTYAPASHTHTNYVDKTSSENIGGTKTFTSIPVLPSTNPTQVNQAIRKGWADSTYSNTNHNHAGVYASVNHNHDGTYAPITTMVGLTRSSAQSISKNTWTAITWTTEEYDTGNYWSSGSAINIPATGVYDIIAYVGFGSNSATLVSIGIYINSETNPRIQSNTPLHSNGVHSNIIAGLKLNINDQVYIKIYHDNSTSLNTQTIQPPRVHVQYVGAG